MRSIPTVVKNLVLPIWVYTRKQFNSSARRTSGEATGAYLRDGTKPNPEVQRNGNLKCDGYKIAYIFTTFPKYSETFFQREIAALSKNLKIDIFSLCGGGGYFENTPIHTFPKWKLLLLPFYCIKHFKALSQLLKRLHKCPRSLSNLGENILGLAFGLIYANSFKEHRYHRIHAAWGTAPAMAGWVIAHLTGIKFSMEAHAYDIYENEGDFFLKEKMVEADFVRTSTQAAYVDLIDLCEDSRKVHLIRRGLTGLANLKLMRAHRSPLRILSVGRLVEKKGLLRQLDLLATLSREAFLFEAKIAGKGPLYRAIEKRIHQLKLKNHVQLEGWVDALKRKELYQWADVMIFTGKVAKNGDRDGLPNVIAEAMGEGLPVISSTVGGSSEAIIHEKTGLLIRNYEKEGEWLDAFKRLASDDALYKNIQLNARTWVENNFDIEKNMQRLRDLLTL